MILCSLHMRVAELKAYHLCIKCAQRMTVLAQVPKLLFAYETDEEQECANALIIWLESGQLPQPLPGEDHFEFKTAIHLQRKHLPLLHLLQRSPDIFKADEDGRRGGIASVESLIAITGTLSWYA